MKPLMSYSKIHSDSNFLETKKHKKHAFLRDLQEYEPIFQDSDNF